MTTLKNLMKGPNWPVDVKTEGSPTMGSAFPQKDAPAYAKHYITKIELDAKKMAKDPDFIEKLHRAKQTKSTQACIYVCLLQKYGTLDKIPKKMLTYIKKFLPEMLEPDKKTE